MGSSYSERRPAVVQKTDAVDGVGGNLPKQRDHILPHTVVGVRKTRRGTPVPVAAVPPGVLIEESSGVPFIRGYGEVKARHAVGSMQLEAYFVGMVGRDTKMVDVLLAKRSVRFRGEPVADTEGIFDPVIRRREADLGGVKLLSPAPASQ